MTRKKKKNTMQHLKLGKLKFKIRKIGCSMSWTRYLSWLKWPNLHHIRSADFWLMSADLVWCKLGDFNQDKTYFVGTYSSPDWWNLRIHSYIFSDFYASTNQIYLKKVLASCFFFQCRNHATLLMKTMKK